MARLHSVSTRQPSLLPSRRAKAGGLAGTRTLDQCLKRALLYQLSYQPLKGHHPKKAAPTRKIIPGSKADGGLNGPGNGRHLSVLQFVFFRI